jgi:hypothetical protein
MQFNFTENQLVALLGTLASGIAVVAGRYLWRMLNAAESGGIAVGWGTAILAICTAGFGATNWNDLAKTAEYPAVSVQDTDVTMRAKIAAWETKKEEVAKAHAAAIVPMTVAVPMTLLAPLIGLMAFMRLQGAYATKAKLDEEREIARAAQRQMNELSAKLDSVVMSCNSAKAEPREASSSPRPMSPSAMKCGKCADCVGSDTVRR